jgi:hypothetical protein
MKAKMKILKTCSLSTIFFKNKSTLKGLLKPRFNFDFLKAHNYHLVKVLKTQKSCILLLFHFARHS